MSINDKDNNDLNLDFHLDEDPNFENLFDEKDKTSFGAIDSKSAKENSFLKDFDTPLDISKKK